MLNQPRIDTKVHEFMLYHLPEIWLFANPSQLYVEIHMKPEQLYQELKDLAEKMDVTVSEQNLRTAGIKVKSGLCTVKGTDMFIMSKHKSVKHKIKMLAAQLANMPHEDIFIVPAVREVLNTYAEKSETE